MHSTRRERRPRSSCRVLMMVSLVFLSLTLAGCGGACGPMGMLGGGCGGGSGPFGGSMMGGLPGSSGGG